MTSTKPVDTLTSSMTYVSHYYPELLPTSAALTLWQFQEQLRISESKNFETNPERAARGWIALDSIKAALLDEKSKSELPSNFLTVAKATLDDIYQGSDVDGNTDYEKKNPNVRRAVKKLWTFPMETFPKWNQLTSSNDDSKDVATVIKLANEILKSDIKASPKLVHGKIYLTLTGFRTTLWNNCRIVGIDLGKLIPLLSRPLIENIETEHVTLVNSDVLARVCASETEKKLLTELLEKWSTKSFSFTVSGLQHTISLDWARFGICLVAAIDLASCLPLQEFMTDFNDLFGKKEKVNIPSPHVTLAIDPR
jgi:hypothetical protein